MPKYNLTVFLKRRMSAAAALILCILMLASCEFSGIGNETQPPPGTDAEITSEREAEPELTTAGVLNSVESDESEEETGKMSLA